MSPTATTPTESEDSRGCGRLCHGERRVLMTKMTRAFKTSALAVTVGRLDSVERARHPPTSSPCSYVSDTSPLQEDCDMPSFP
jgi:hypothetical protein